MRMGANWPYDSRATEATWDLFRLLDPAEVTISSHEADAVYERLLDEYPGERLLWHIRMKGNRAWWPADVADVEWDNERSLVDRAAWLIARGVVPCLILGNEPDIELAAEPVDHDGNRAHAAGAYLHWAAEAIDRLRREVPAARIALAPLSQGNPDRFGFWFGQYRASGLLPGTDFISEHAYTDGRPFDDRDWGGRPLSLANLGMPVHVTETNDNGRYAAQDPHERADDFAGYATFLRDSGAVESLSIFTLPGGAQDASKPSWWFVGPEIVTAVADALATGTPPVAVPPPPIPPEVPRMATLDTLRAARWRALDASIPLNAESAIYRYWAARPALGSPITAEVSLEDGTTAQAFANAILQWTGGDNVQEVAS